MSFIRNFKLPNKATKTIEKDTWGYVEVHRKSVNQLWNPYFPGNLTDVILGAFKVF